MRVLKARKVLGNAQLVAEVLDATKERGALAPADIKRNVDRLVEKEYLERREGGGVAYVA